MLLSIRTARRAVSGAVGAGAIATAVVAMSAGIAAADPPDCTSADAAGVASGVAAAASAYLFAHPDVNDFMTTLKDKPMEQKRAELQVYLDANPQVKADLQQIRQPMTDLKARCQ
jgi:hemophore-related protein